MEMFIMLYFNIVSISVKLKDIIHDKIVSTLENRKGIN